jgi:hypothetical protein
LHRDICFNMCIDIKHNIVGNISLLMECFSFHKLNNNKKSKKYEQK